VTTYSAEINDDIAHPEGGHALIVFRGLQFIPQDLALVVEAIDPALGLGALRPDGPVAAKLTEKGLEIAVGPEIADRIAAGTAVSVALGNEVDAEALWPSLAPWMPPRRRQGRVNQPPQRVVVTAKPPAQTNDGPAPVAAAKPSEIVDAPKVVDLTETKKDAVNGADLKKPDDVVATPTPVVIAADEQPAPTQITPPPVAKKPRIPTAIVALMAGAGFVAGAALMFFLHDALVGSANSVNPEPFAAVGPKLSAPYEMLGGLPMTSPRGLAVNLDERQLFLTRGLALRTKDGAESDFWIKWAARSALMQPATSGALTALGVLVARGHETSASLTTARFIWALAALSGDCGALRNLAMPHVGVDAKAIDASDAAQWQDAARRAGCPSNK
jgi:hypothetical protein